MRQQGLCTQKDFDLWSKTNRPLDIPSNPQHFYKGEWVSWGEFLGSKKKSYKEAKAFMHQQGLRTVKEFKMWRKPNRPLDIPGDPDKFYMKTGEWVSWPDFLRPPDNRRRDAKG